MLGYAKLIKPLHITIMFKPVEIPIGTIVKLLSRKQNQSEYEIHICLDRIIKTKSYIESAIYKIVDESYLELIGNCIQNEY